MVNEYLTHAFAFVYVIDSSRHGGIETGKVGIEITLSFYFFFLATSIVISGYNFLYFKDAKVTRKQLWARIVLGKNVINLTTSIAFGIHKFKKNCMASIVGCVSASDQGKKALNKIILIMKTCIMLFWRLYSRFFCLFLHAIDLTK